MNRVTCHAPGCAADRDPKHLTCPPHWARVPEDLQKAFYAAGARDKRNGVIKSDQWHTAASDVLTHLANSEGRPGRHRPHD